MLTRALLRLKLDDRFQRESTEPVPTVAVARLLEEFQPAQPSCDCQSVCRLFLTFGARVIGISETFPD